MPGDGGEVLEREWVSIRDPEDDHLRYTFDVAFLLSRYQCIYGAGCPGIRPDSPRPDEGCCIHGAYYVDQEDRDRIEELVAAELDSGVMQRYDEAMRAGVTELDDEGEARTRVVDGTCIFLNSGDFPGGMGCSFHVLAMNRGEHHMTYKPWVCWQVPLHRTIAAETANDGASLEVHTIGAFERGAWGDGGADFHWWCTEQPEAFTASEPVYLAMERELRTMVGDPVYEELATYLGAREGDETRVAFLPVVD